MEMTELQQLEAVFSVRSVPRCYRWDKLGATVSQSVKRKVERWCKIAASLGVSWSNESVVGYLPASRGISGRGISGGHC
jgi:hypothetical protein